MGWDGHAVAEAYRVKWPAFSGALRGTGPFGVIHEVPLGASIPVDDVTNELLGVSFTYVLQRAAAGRPRLRVLDWGGALGHYALIARANLPELELDYHVKELQEVCVVGRELVPDVVFHETDDCLKHSYDVVFVSGTLECLPDWRYHLSRLAEAASVYLYITRVPVALRARSFVGAQRVHTYGYGSAIPFWVIARDELLGEARKIGLSLVREFVTGEEGDIPGAPERPFPCRGFLFAVANP
jgi:putative methyltransferase (TIGR04325 family)